MPRKQGTKPILTEWDLSTKLSEIRVRSIEAIEQAMKEGADVEILPNGEVRIKATPAQPEKPLTFRENLGAEYSHV